MLYVRLCEFITLLGGAAATWPLAAWAQQVNRARRIVFFHALAENDSEAQARIAAFQQGLVRSDGLTTATFKSSIDFSAATSSASRLTRRNW
jgi:hypothetical protein